MGFLSAIGAIGGSLFGGPVGGAIGSTVGGLLEGNSGAKAAKQAAAQTGAATDKAIALQREMWQAQQAQQKPWIEAGTTALNKLVPLSEYTSFGTNQFNADPGYAFRMSEGMKALDRSAAARGGLLSGATLKGAQRYGQELGSQEYQNAFNRYQTERQARLGPYQALAGIGQSATNNLGSAGQQYGQNVGNALISQGYAAGNAGLASAQSRNSAYGDIGKVIGGVTPQQWSSAGDYLKNLF